MVAMKHLPLIAGCVGLAAELVVLVMLPFVREPYWQAFFCLTAVGVVSLSFQIGRLSRRSDA